MRKSLFGAAVLAAVFTASAALAHITVAPRQVAAGSQQVLVVRVPNESATATVKVVADFPEGLSVTGIDPVEGWTIAPRRNAAGAIVGATWSGSLALGQTAELRLQAQAPNTVGPLMFRFIQTYADGTVMEWTGPRGSRTPAPLVELTSGP